MKYSLLLLALILHTRTYSQQSMDMTRAIELAINNTPSLNIWQLDVQRISNLADPSLHGKSPIINAELSNNNNINRNYIPNFTIESKSTAINGGLNASWTLYDGGQIKFSIQQAEMNVSLAEVQMKQELLSIINNVSKQYNAALLAQEQVKVMAANIEMDRKRITYENARKEFGQSNSFNVHQFQDALYRDSTVFRLQRLAYDRALNDLKLLIRLDPKEKLVLTEKLDYQEKSYNWDEMMEQAIEKNPQLTALEWQERISEMDIHIQESSFKPSLALNGAINGATSLNNQNNINLFTLQEFGSYQASNWAIDAGLRLTYPLYDGGRRRKLLENAKLNRELSVLNKTDFRDRLASQLNNLILAYKERLSVLALELKKLENAETLQSISMERYKLGQINSIDLRNTQLSAIDARLSYLNAIYELLLIDGDIQEICGGLKKY